MVSTAISPASLPRPIRSHNLIDLAACDPHVPMAAGDRETRSIRLPPEGSARAFAVNGSDTDAQGTLAEVIPTIMPLFVLVFEGQLQSGRQVVFATDRGAKLVEESGACHHRIREADD